MAKQQSGNNVTTIDDAYVNIPVLSTEPPRAIKGIKSKTKALILCSALALTVSAGLALAYLTDTDSIINQFNLDTNLSIQLEEPSFDATQVNAVAPAQQIAKDPTITNDGSVEAYIAADVKVPVFSGQILDADDKLKDVVDRDLFAYEANSGWSLLNTSEVVDGYKTYTYVYDSSLEGGASANPIFSEIVVANLTKGIDFQNTQIDVVAYAIQKYGFDSAQDAYAAYKAQSAKAVVVSE